MYLNLAILDMYPLQALQTSSSIFQKYYFMQLYVQRYNRLEWRKEEIKLE